MIEYSCNNFDFFYIELELWLAVSIYLQSYQTYPHLTRIHSLFWTRDIPDSTYKSVGSYDGYPCVSCIFLYQEWPLSLRSDVMWHHGSQHLSVWIVHLSCKYLRSFLPVRLSSTCMITIIFIWSLQIDNHRW